MGKRGPIREPAAFALLKGRKAVADERGTAPNGAPRMPGDLDIDTRKIWRAVVPRIAALGILSPLDQYALRDMCVCLTRLLECEADISARGVLVEGERGKVKNPALQIARQYRESLQKWSQKFGLTPGDRDRIDLPPPPRESADDRFERFLSS